MRRPPSSPPRSARGQVSWVTLLLLAMVVGGGYLAWAWTPIYIYQFQARQVVRDYINQAVRIHDDRRQVEKMCNRLRALGELEVVDARGDLRKVPAVDVQPRAVVWERDDRAKTLHVALEYVTTVRYPYLDRQVEKAFAIEFTEDITVPKWDTR